ncbi:hypothetical protein CR513_04645, partial [Mucuna pruriens]
MIDAASGGALMDKTPATTRVVDNLRLENQLTELTSLVRQLVVGQHQPSIAVIDNRLHNIRHHRSNNNNNRECQLKQTMSSSNMQFQQNMNATIQDLKMQIEQLANTVSQLQSDGSGNLASQTIPNPRGNASAVTLRSGKALPQSAPQQLPRSTDADS